MNKIFKILVSVSVLFWTTTAYAEKADFKDFLQQSLSPLQDQVRFYNHNVKLAKNGCDDKNFLRIYNLVEHKGKINYECVGNYGNLCQDKCLGGGIYIGNYTPEIPCNGEKFFAGTEKENSFTVTKEICQDSKKQKLWERTPTDAYVFDYMGRLLFLSSDNVTMTFRNNRLQRKIMYSADETMLYDAENTEAYLHIRYERAENGNLLKEIHFNRDGFPYSIYEAEYQNGRCVKISKTDGFSGNKEVYEFK